jgi:hypothetical protein
MCAFVVHVALGLGDAYIAPTENLIHNGAVEPGHRDLTLTVRGFLRPM